jgi:hypothetical protein
VDDDLADDHALLDPAPGFDDAPGSTSSTVITRPRRDDASDV